MKSSNLSTLTINSGIPLSMDIFMEGYRKMQMIADDKMALEKLAIKQQWRRIDYHSSLWLINGHTTLVTTPKLKIVFASSSLAALSGYQPEEVIGFTPNLFQGELTDKQDKERIKKLIKEQTAFEASIVNYRKNGSLYRCHIRVLPMFNQFRELVNYIALEKEISMAVG